jgi:hypothetical protein
MRIYQEKIAPPTNPPSDEEQMRLIAESLARDDRWVKNIVDGLAGILRASIGDLFHIKLKHAVRQQAVAAVLLASPAEAGRGDRSRT